MKKTYDYTHRYRGIWHGGWCRIAVYEPDVGEEGRCPVIVAAERDDNAGSSVTNMAEYLAAEVVARHFPHLLNAPAERALPSARRWRRGAGRRWRGEAVARWGR